MKATDSIFRRHAVIVCVSSLGTGMACYLKRLSLSWHIFGGALSGELPNGPETQFSVRSSRQHARSWSDWRTPEINSQRSLGF